MSDPSSSSSMNSSSSSSSSMNSSPSSSSPLSSSAGGMPLGSASQSSSPSQGSSFSFGQDPGSSTDATTELSLPPRPKEQVPFGSIEVPLEIVVVCRRNDLLVHPGGYRLTKAALEEKRPGDDGLLVREIRAIVWKRAVVDPLVRPKPSIKLLVESNGGSTFAIARRQLFFAVPKWPVSLQVAGSQEPHIFKQGTW
jgi:hypothetical protein